MTVSIKKPKVQFYLKPFFLNFCIMDSPFYSINLCPLTVL